MPLPLALITEQKTSEDACIGRQHLACRGRGGRKSELDNSFRYLLTPRSATEWTSATLEEYRKHDAPESPEEATFFGEILRRFESYRDAFHFLPRSHEWGGLVIG